MRPAFLEAHLKREPITVQKYQLLWQFYVKNGQPLRAAEVLGALAESNQSVTYSFISTGRLISAGAHNIGLTSNLTPDWNI